MAEAVALHLVVAHLRHELRPHRRLLELAAAPPVRLGESPLGRVLQQRLHARQDLVVALRADGRRTRRSRSRPCRCRGRAAAWRGATASPSSARRRRRSRPLLNGFTFVTASRAPGQVREAEALRDHAVQPGRLEACRASRAPCRRRACTAKGGTLRARARAPCAASRAAARAPACPSRAARRRR